MDIVLADNESIKLVTGVFDRPAAKKQAIMFALQVCMYVCMYLNGYTVCMYDKEARKLTILYPFDS